MNSHGMERRDFLRLGGATAGCALTAPLADWAVALQGSGLRFKYSICNEVFEKWDFAPTCKEIRRAGYDGVEIAPFTLAENVDDISAARRRELRDIMRSEGISFAGLHWLLITPKWLQVSTADQAIRKKSWEYFAKLIDFCADLGERGIMVLGSPKQRGSQGNTAAEATKNLKDGLASVAARAGGRGVTIALEPLASKDTDVVNTTQQAVAIVKEINHPAIQTMFDFHNTLDEREPLDSLVRRYFSLIRHVHVNEMDGRHPGTGKLDFLPVFRVLAELKYAHWVSLEVFEFKPGPVQIASEAMRFFRALEPKLGVRP